MISDDEFLERIVAGINAHVSPEAKVQWNIKLEGRQFDVVLEFDLGPYEILMLIEVKHHTRKTPAADIEAFITKARDQNANKIIFVNKAGYQSGARKVAKRHGIELFQVKFVPGDLSSLGRGTSVTIPINPDATFGTGRVTFGQLPPGIDVKEGPTATVNQVSSCEIFYTDGRDACLPGEPTQMTYYVEKSKFADGRTISDVISTVAGKDHSVGKTSTEVIQINPPSILAPPDEYFFPKGEVKSLKLKINPIEMKTLTGTTKVEPTSISPIVEYKNVITDKKIEMPAGNLPLGMGHLEVGKFYFSYFPLRYYHCDALENGMATISLIESFQHGDLVRGTYKQKAKYSVFYIPVSDPKIRIRLEKRLSDMRALSKRGK